MKITQTQSLNKLGVGSVILFMGVISCLLVPHVPQSADAEEGSDDVTTEVAAEVHSSISLAVQSSIEIDAAPKASGNFSSNSAKLTVATNSTGGYSLYMQTGDGTSELKSVNLANEQTIGPVEMNTQDSDFAANTWGYSLNGTFYNPVPSGLAQPVFQTTTTTHRDDYDLYFGVSVDESLPVGRYSNQVVISAIANPTVATSMNEVSYMQAMTSEICKNTAEGFTKQLIDTRDGRKYWVAKMKDENCWMTQNLALDITEKGLSKMDTDIVTDWDATNYITNPPEPTYTQASLGTSSSVTAESWNLNDGGEYIIATPLLRTGCGNVKGNLSECVKVGMVNVAGEKFRPGYKAQMGDWEGANATVNTLLAVNCTEWEGTGTSKTCIAGEYDEHYAVGNYYEFNTATAGTGERATVSGVVASGSICPKGWKLPLSSTAYNNVSGSFYYLLNKYGVAGVLENADTGYNVAREPLYFIRSGSVTVSNSQGTLGNAASEGMYFSSVAHTADAMYILLITGGTINPSYDTTSTLRQYGRTVRCIAQ